MEEKTVYAPRFLARLIDLLLVILTISIIEGLFPYIKFNLLVCFWAYNVVVILLNGRTMGKFTASIQVDSPFSGMRKIIQLAIRELLFLVLLPLLFLNFVTVSSIALHDRIMQTRISRDDS